MNYYVIGIGGTGAKCVQALTHLSAAGLMPDGDLYALFVDPDRANGSLELAEITLQQYVDCRKLELGSTDLFKTLITIPKPDVWSPFVEKSESEGEQRTMRDEKTAKPDLIDLFGYDDLSQRNKPAADLFDVLYSRGEKTTPLHEGFLGHPSIGAAVMAKTVDLGNDEPWKTFRKRLEADAKTGRGARIVLIGSIFGGTGAAGIPTIARLVTGDLQRIGIRNVQLGAVLMLPYFSFDRVEGERLKANSDNFLLSTQAALMYYYIQRHLRMYKAVYLLGDQVLSPVRRPSRGGKKQKNEPHFVELYAALASLDFFQNIEAADYRVVARREVKKLGWSDLPYWEGFQVLRRKIEQLARFSFAYLCSYHPMLGEIKKIGGGYRSPWYVDFFERPGVNLEETLDKELERVREYCESFLRWLAHVQTSAKDLKIELVAYRSFANKEQENGKNVVTLLEPGDFKFDEFGDLVLPLAKRKLTLNRVWERMSDCRVRDKDASGVGRFINALHHECR